MCFSFFCKMFPITYTYIRLFPIFKIQSLGRKQRKMFKIRDQLTQFFKPCYFHTRIQLVMTVPLGNRHIKSIANLFHNWSIQCMWFCLFKYKRNINTMFGKDFLCSWVFFLFDPSYGKCSMRINEASKPGVCQQTCCIFVAHVPWKPLKIMLFCGAQLVLYGCKKRS